MPDFSDTSPHLDLPYIQPSQAQKHITHNEGMQRLDALVQLAVISASAATPPGAPETGARYILPGSPTGLWSVQAAGTLAVYDGTAWAYYTPRAGWTAWVDDTGLQMVFDGAAWQEAAGAPTDFQNLPEVGIGTTADSVNRLAVASDAVLLSHAGAGHQVKVNKSAPGDTASLLFQTGWSGRAEMGTAGTDDFAIKVSADGSSFQTALVADAATGAVSFPQGLSGLSPADFGTGALTTTGYVAARGTNLVTNGTGLLGNGYNYPSAFSFDAATAPNLPGSVSFAGHYPGPVEMTEFIPVDPNNIYRLESYLRQEGLPGDWSAWSNAERQTQAMGLICYDIDGNDISASQHMRYRHGGTDSLTTLTAPLAPGDVTVQLADTSGWNESATQSYNRGLILMGYQNSLGYTYDYYSRLVEFGLFDLGQVDKSAHTVTLNTPLPASLGNPDDPAGVWPIGTRIANSSSGSARKYSFYAPSPLPETDRWYRSLNHVGGVDLSGENTTVNFPPGTAYVRVFWMPNFSNKVGGSSNYPDTGNAHKAWYAGVSVMPEPAAMMQATATGAKDLRVPQGDFGAGTLGLVAPSTQITAL